MPLDFTDDKSRQQAITWAIVDPDPCRQMASLGLKEPHIHGGLYEIYHVCCGRFWVFVSDNGRYCHRSFVDYWYGHILSCWSIKPSSEPPHIYMYLIEIPFSIVMKVHIFLPNSRNQNWFHVIFVTMVALLKITDDILRLFTTELLFHPSVQLCTPCISANLTYRFNEQFGV